jgi:hypothetical protein
LFSESSQLRQRGILDNAEGLGELRDDRRDIVESLENPICDPIQSPGLSVEPLHGCCGRLCGVQVDAEGSRGVLETLEEDLREPSVQRVQVGGQCVGLLAELRGARCTIQVLE